MNATAADSIIIDQSIYDVRPDYAAFVIIAKGVANAPSDIESQRWLSGASESIIDSTGDARVEAWREAYRSVGMKPQKFRPSVDALIRRASGGLPAINKIVDAYNSISVRHQLPIGGEDLSKYVGAPRLTRADGNESFQTVEDGEQVVEIVEPGEVIWRDDAGVTCRRWSWRQCLRTRIDLDTTEMFFLLERLEPMPIEELVRAGGELAFLLESISPHAELTRRLIEPRH